MYLWNSLPATFASFTTFSVQISFGAYSFEVFTLGGIIYIVDANVAGSSYLRIFNPTIGMFTQATLLRKMVVALSIGSLLILETAGILLKLWMFHILVTSTNE